MTKTIISLILILSLMLFGVCCAENANEDSFVGVFTEIDDGVTRLRVLPDGAAYAVTLDIYRLVGLEFTADKNGSILRGTAGIDGDATAVVEISSGKLGPVATVVECDWSLLEPGTVFTFVPGAPDMDPETFEWLFTERLTGIAGTAGVSLKQAGAAADLLSALVSSDAGYCDPDHLAAAVAEALGSMDADARAELDENLSSVASLLDAAFGGDESVRGAFEDAGVWDTVAALLGNPLAKADWEAFRAAYDKAKE